jgi:hypothetical protein
MRARRVGAIVVGLLLIGGAGRLWAQSLGEVAKKEEERRKSVQSAGKVYTNKDLGSVPPATTSPGGTASAGTPESAPASESAKDASAAKDTKPEKDDKDANAAKQAAPKGQDDPKGQAYWANRMKALQTALDRDLTFADALQSRINALSADFVNRDDPAQRAVIERDRQKALSELERIRTQIVQDRKAVTELEEEARRAGVPPGWLR